MKRKFIYSRKKWLFLMIAALILMLRPTAAQAKDTRPDYAIMVNRAANCITVYEKDPATGEYSAPVIAFTCSTGMNNITRAGVFATGSRSNYYLWRPLVKKVYAQYAVRFNGHILFHSAPYLQCDPSTLIWEEYNRLGEQASAGCVRLACIDAKWIYDNCKPGTPVVVYDDAEYAGPLGKPASIQLTPESLSCGWDPTDPDINNPWGLVRPVLQLTTNTPGDGVLYLPAGSTAEILKGSIGLFTPQGDAYLPDDYTLEVYGNYDLNIPGNYQLFVRGFDTAAGLRADQTFVLSVLPQAEETAEPTASADAPETVDPAEQIN